MLQKMLMRCLDQLRARRLFRLLLKWLLLRCEMASALMSLILMTAHSRTLHSFDAIICMLKSIMGMDANVHIQKVL